MIFISALACADTLKIPVDDLKKWEVLTYAKIRPNSVTSSAEGLFVDVNASASPLIYPLKKPLAVSEIAFTAKIQGDIDLQGNKQGEKGADDFVLRIGLVFEGDKKLNFFQRSIAADWVKRLFSLAPKNTGIDKIQFYNVYSDDILQNTQRQHPLSELISENFIIKNNASGEIQSKIPLNNQHKVLAIWISIDGDDTKSRFSVLLKELSLTSK